MIRPDTCPYCGEDVAPDEGREVIGWAEIGGRVVDVPTRAHEACDAAEEAWAAR